MKNHITELTRSIVARRRSLRKVCSRFQWGAFFFCFFLWQSGFADEHGGAGRGSAGHAHGSASSKANHAEADTGNNSSIDNSIFSFSDGDYSGSLTGYFTYGANVFQNNQNGLNNGARLIGAKTYGILNIGPAFSFNASVAWLMVPLVQSLYASYTASNFGVIAGQFQPNFGLANAAYSPYLPFIEAPLTANAIVPNYGYGGGFGLNSNVLAFSFSITGPQVDTEVQGHNPVAYVSRLVYAPIHRADADLHFGFSWWGQKPDGSDSWSFSTVPEVQALNNPALLATGPISNVSMISSSDLEFAGVYHQFSLQSEYMLTHFDEKSQGDLNFKGYYVTAGYFLTGESQLYSFPIGAFVGITPIKHSYGALQLNAQYSRQNFNDRFVVGGDETNLSLGLNWYLNQHIVIHTQAMRIMSLLPVTRERYNNNAYSIALDLLF